LSQFTVLFTQFITNVYVQTGLIGIIVAMAIESCCIPLPSEVVMPVGGLLLAQNKLLPGIDPVIGIVLLGLAGSVGGLLGSVLAYYIGYKGGRPLMLKYGRYVLISQHDADKADSFFQRWGSATVFFGRLLPVIRTYISLPAGISKMSFTRFCIYSFLGSVPWCIFLAYLGTVLKNNMATIEPIFKGADVVIAVAVVLLIVLYVWRHIRHDKKARAEHAAMEAANQQQAQAQGWDASAQPQQPMWQQNPQPQQWQQPQSSQSSQAWTPNQQSSQSQPPRWS
jgi:membrane protein DedA with SNARE-associated domain